MRRIALRGATGSIGGSTLDVVARHPARFRAVALSAHRDVAGLVARCRTASADYAAIADPALEGDLARALREAGLPTRALAGPAALEALATLPEVDTVVAAVVGAAGLRSTLAAAAAGKRILLANKESIVMAGPLLASALARGGGSLLPVDSEHNAVFQCLPAGYAGDPDRHGVAHVVLTASGGPFRGRSATELDAVTPEQACAHPNWRMGRKISVDSATLMNKGLEVIEAHHLFGLPAPRIEVVIHPQSVIHSLVAYRDGSMLAQLGNPDMRTAIAHALAHPERIEAGVATLDLAAIARLSFEPPDRTTFRCLGLAYDALVAGGTAPAILNAANEVAVEAFLAGRTRFCGIATTVAATLEALAAGPIAALDDALAADAAARRFATGWIGRRDG
ncbi:MAG: 1-deoxy-D-xylulose-5-phosphate reductoisomerase [Pseudomonadota bacterium]